MKLASHSNELFVGIGSIIDIERLYQYSRNEKFSELDKNKDLTYFSVHDLGEAKRVCIEFIKYYALGCSNWVGGRVIDANNNFIAQISYNGRIWNNENWKIATEIKL